MEDFLKDLEEFLDWGEIDSWKESKYTRLSELIFEKTKQNISNNTLKRITGKISSYEGYEPTEVTKDALAQVMGYKHWSDYILKTKNVKLKSLKKFAPAVLFILLLFLIIATGYRFALNAIIGEKPYFSSENLIGGIPSTIHINYDIREAKQDTFWISFNSGKDWAVLAKQDTGISHAYYLPGYYNIDIKAENFSEKMKAHIIHDNWVGGVNWHWDETGLIPDLSPVHDGVLYIPHAKVRQLGFDTAIIYFTSFNLSKTFDVSVDSLEFEARIKLDDVHAEDLCRWGNIQLIGEKGKMQIPFTPYGCHRWADVVVSEQEYSGGKYNNSQFVFNNANERWINVRVKTKTNTVFAEYDGKQIYEKKYTNNIGTLKCIKFKFNRSGKVDKLLLKDIKGNIVLEDDFLGSINNDE